MSVTVATSDTFHPWSSGQQEDSRFHRILAYTLVVFALLAVAMPLLPVTEISHEEHQVIPPPLARIILEKKELPKPEPVKPKEKKKPKKKEPEKKKPKKKKPLAKAKPNPKVDLVKLAKDKAAVSGVLAFQDDLMEMRDSLDVNSLSKTDLSQGEAKAAKVERSIIASKAKSTSGGIQTAALSRDTGGSALSGKQTTRVASSIDTLSKKNGQNGASATMGGRSDQSVRRIMDRSKGAIFAVYNRALRKDPTLEGKFVFEMLIQPDGSVSAVKLLASELDNEALVKKILSRIKLIRFPAGNVINTRVNYSFDFLPY